MSVGVCLSRRKPDWSAENSKTSIFLTYFYQVILPSTHLALTIGINSHGIHRGKKMMGSRVRHCDVSLVCVCTCACGAGVKSDEGRPAQVSPGVYSKASFRFRSASAESCGPCSALHSGQLVLSLLQGRPGKETHRLAVTLLSDTTITLYNRHISF